MIGPSSGPSGMPTREVIDNSVRIKRKIFEDLDIESLCDEVCEGGKKRFLTELHAPCIDDGMSMETNLIDTTEFSSSSSSEISNIVGGSVARLEVLVVDGTWDPSSLGNSEFTDLTTTLDHDSSIPILNDVHQTSDNGYGTILSYWEPPSSSESAQNGSTSGPQVHITNPTQSVISSISSSQPIEDQENGNLSWLLDFKLDSFIEAPEERSTFPATRDNPIGHRNRYNVNSSRSSVPTSFVNETRKNSNNQHESATVASTNTSLKQQETRQPSVTTGNYASSDNRSFAISRYAGPKKPPFTYTELIEHALQERGELTVSAIYQWISEHFPYYKSNDDRWKNSVRHNLSINPHFRKGSKAPHGAGHLWAIANRGDTRPRQLMTVNGTVLPTQRQFIKNLADSNNSRKPNNVNSQIVTMDEVAAATASISQPEDNNPVQSSVTLEHCAEQILSGIKREVEVQYLVPMVVSENETEQEHVQIPQQQPQQQQPHQQEQQQTESNDQECPIKESDRDCWNVLADFLNPVSKEEVAEECGLIGEGYLVTDLNPTALGLNMVEPEIITPDNLFGEELSFQFYELTSPSQLQSA